MGADARPYARLQRALDAGLLVQAESAAREMRVVSLEDSLRLLLLMRDRQDPRFERAAVRWLGRVLAATPDLGLRAAREAAENLQGLNGASPDVARARLAVILRSVELVAAARVLERG